MEYSHGSFESEFGNVRILIAEEPDRIIRGEQRVELPHCLAGGRGYRCEGCDVGWVAACVTGAHGEVSMLRLKRLANGVNEQSLRQMAHSF